MKPCRTVNVAAVLALAACLTPLASPTPAQGSSPPRTGGQRANARTPLQSLVQAEKEFAALATKGDTRKAFLANLADESIVFAPLPADGRMTWQTRTPPAGTLRWEPAFAEVSASGDFGFTTGPWELRPPAQSRDDVLAGQYLSVWRRNGKDPWKLVLDVGVSHALPETKLTETRFQAGPDHPVATATASESASAASVLIESDRALGGGDASARTASDVRYLGEGAPPLAGKPAAEKLASATKGSTWRPIDAGLARTGDFGYTYGIREGSSSPPDTTVYAHVWRRLEGKPWQLVAVIENPLRRKAK